MFQGTVAMRMGGRMVQYTVAVFMNGVVLLFDKCPHNWEAITTS